MSADASSNSTQAAAWRLQVPDADTVAGSEVRPDSLNADQNAPFDSNNHLQVDPIDYRDGGKYRSIVKIQSRFTNKETGDQTWAMGSGWLIGSDVIATAGHCVFDHANGNGAADQIQCSIGYNGRESAKTSDAQTRYGVNVVTKSQWIQPSEDRHKDVAFIQVQKDFQGDLRLFKFADAPPSGSSQVQLGVVGYPGDQDGDYGAHMYERFKQIEYDAQNSAQHMIEYKLSTFGGQSGAPVLRKDWGRLVAVGTHVYGGGAMGEHSNNSIRGGWDSNYKPFINLFNEDKSAIQGSEILNNSHAEEESVSAFATPVTVEVPLLS